MLIFLFQVEITLALGQLIRNDLFDEIEPHFQQLAYFRTRIGNIT